MESETVKELGIEVFSDEQNVSSVRCRQGRQMSCTGRAPQRGVGSGVGSWAEGLAGGSLSQHVYTFCPRFFSRKAQVILGR